MHISRTIRWHRRTGPIGAVVALCLGTALCPASARAQAPTPAWPQRPVRIVVPFDAGGIADITARLLAERMSQALPQQVVVENRPGAGGVAATELVVKAPADGHVLLLISNGSAVSASLFRSLPFDIQRDVAPISTLGFFDIVLVTRGDGGHATLAELVADARAHPGKLNAGTISIGSTQNLAAELFKSVAGLDLQTVPFKSTSAVVAALRANDVQIGFELLGPVFPQVRAGALRVLAVASDRRFPGLPNVPTAAEAGVPGYLASSWNGLAAPSGTPRPVIDRIQQAMASALTNPALRARLADLGVEARSSSPEATRELLSAEIVKWRSVIERAHIERQ